MKRKQVDVASMLNTKNASGRTPLMFLREQFDSDEDNGDLLGFLLDHGVDLNATDAKGDTCLQIYAINGQEK